MICSWFWYVRVVLVLSRYDIVGVISLMIRCFVNVISFCIIMNLVLIEDIVVDCCV